jgi:hypothetical protein
MSVIFVPRPFAGTLILTTTPIIGPPGSALLTDQTLAQAQLSDQTLSQATLGESQIGVATLNDRGS